MSSLASHEGALDLSQGFPDFDGPERLLELVNHYVSRGFNQYAPMPGIEPLREGIGQKIKELYGTSLNPDSEITVTSGATEALFCAITATVRPGEEVVLFDPAYDSYSPAVRLSGGLCVRLPLQGPDFRPDWNRVRDATNDRTRLIIINTPHNPTGGAWEESDVESLQEIVANRDIYVISDEVYEHIIFDDLHHVSLTRYPELFAKSFVISSFGKTYHTTGWKVGYCVAPPALTKEFRGIHQWVNFTTPTPLQYAIADYLKECPQHHYQLSNFYQRKRDLFCGFLKASRFKLTPSSGTYFQLLDYTALSDERDVDFARRLTIERKIASIPISGFYETPPNQNYLRFCFAKDDDTLAAAAEILCRL